MRLFVTTLTAIVLFPALLNAQQKFHEDTERTFRFGAKAGVNINKIEGQAFNESFRYNYMLGGFLQWNFSRRFGIQPEINFTQTSSEITSDETDIYDDIFLGGDQKKAKLNYFKIPILLNIDIGQSQRVKLQLGPQWGQLMNSKVDSLRQPGRDIFRKGEFSLLGGLLLQLPLINIGARYEMGLTNLNDVSNQDKWRSQAFHIFAGVTF
ncbi:porin family protein [Terrimonas ferruginea]|uniref:porin family protein n=1 Tax=Terrimonas ferruginea TaxID=249 RepID=UPI00041F399B|nr:porin family protein [Terrimonas ferruginea]